MVELLTEWFNTLNAELNPICHLLALLRAHHILHVSRIRVKKKYSIVYSQKKSNILRCKEHHVEAQESE